jgi:hypothetical protein
MFSNRSHTPRWLPGSLLLVALFGLAVPTAEAQNFSSFHSRRDPRTGRIYYFGTEYRNGQVSTRVGRIDRNGGTEIKSGSGRSHVSGGYRHYNSHGGSSFYWRQ